MIRKVIMIALSISIVLKKKKVNILDTGKIHKSKNLSVSLKINLHSHFLISKLTTKQSNQDKCGTGIKTAIQVNKVELRVQK